MAVCHLPRSVVAPVAMIFTDLVAVHSLTLHMLEQPFLPIPVSGNEGCTALLLKARQLNALSKCC